MGFPSLVYAVAFQDGRSYAVVSAGEAKAYAAGPATSNQLLPILTSYGDIRVANPYYTIQRIPNYFQNLRISYNPTPDSALGDPAVKALLASRVQTQAAAPQTPQSPAVSVVAPSSGVSGASVGNPYNLSPRQRFVVGPHTSPPVQAIGPYTIARASITRVSAKLATRDNPAVAAAIPNYTFRGNPVSLVPYASVGPLSSGGGSPPAQTGRFGAGITRSRAVDSSSSGVVYVSAQKVSGRRGHRRTTIEPVTTPPLPIAAVTSTIAPTAVGITPAPTMVAIPRTVVVSSLPPLQPFTTPLPTPGTPGTPGPIQALAAPAPTALPPGAFVTPLGVTVIPGKSVTYKGTMYPLPLLSIEGIPTPVLIALGVPGVQAPVAVAAPAPAPPAPFTPAQIASILSAPLPGQPIVGLLVPSAEAAIAFGFPGIPAPTPVPPQIAAEAAAAQALAQGILPGTVPAAAPQATAAAPFQFTQPPTIPSTGPGPTLAPAQAAAPAFVVAQQPSLAPAPTVPFQFTQPPTIPFPQATPTTPLRAAPQQTALPFTTPLPAVGLGGFPTQAFQAAAPAAAPPQRVGAPPPAAPPTPRPAGPPAITGPPAPTGPPATITVSGFDPRVSGFIVGRPASAVEAIAQQAGGFLQLVPPGLLQQLFRRFPILTTENETLFQGILPFGARLFLPSGFPSNAFLTPVSGIQTLADGTQQQEFMDQQGHRFLVRLKKQA